MSQDRIREQADEVADLMALRLGGAQRGEAVDLTRMMRRRGAALPRRLRRDADWLAEAAVQAGHPRIARQLDARRADQAHRRLVRHLRPLGQATRLAQGALNVTATVMFALLIVGGLAVWFLHHSGRI